MVKILVIFREVLEHYYVNLNLNLNDYAQVDKGEAIYAKSSNYNGDKKI